MYVSPTMGHVLFTPAVEFAVSLARCRQPRGQFPRLCGRSPAIALAVAAAIILNSDAVDCASRAAGADAVDGTILRCGPDRDALVVNGSIHRKNQLLREPAFPPDTASPTQRRRRCRLCYCHSRLAGPGTAADGARTDVHCAGGVRALFADSARSRRPSGSGQDRSPRRTGCPGARGGLTAGQLDAHARG